MILLGQQRRLNDLLAGLLLLSFSAISLWAALFAPDEGFSGGIPLVSRETNMLIGRWLFGVGALATLALFG